MSKRAVYAWCTLAILAVVLATLVPWWLLHEQTSDIEHLARAAVCISLAEQERLHQSEGLEPLDLAAGCFGLTAKEILHEFQHTGATIK